MYLLVVNKDGRFLPILTEEESCEIMASFSSIEEAQDFAHEHILCSSHETLIIDLNSMLVEIL